VLPESLPVFLDEAGAVGRFFAPHAVEDGSGGWVRLAQAVGEIAVHPLVLLLERDREREDLGFRQIAARVVLDT
jgi:hypothetical protein